jgi:four helix bundle protein
MHLCRAMTVIADELRQRILRYTLRIITFCKDLPDAWEVRELGRQLLRAGMGVAGNYWSACRGRSDREFIAKLGVAVDEAEESVLWLTAFIQSGIRDAPDAEALLAEGKELRAILSASHRTARKNRQQNRKLETKSPTRQFTKSPISTAKTP